MDVRLALSVILVVILAGCLSTAQPVREEVDIVRVIDGDTVETAAGERIRLLGINTPERGTRYYAPARTRLVQLVKNQTVQIESGSDPYDQYGRRLAYMFRNDTLINRILIEDGLATPYFLGETTRFDDQIRAATEYARSEHRGVWERSIHTNCINITSFNPDPDGNDNHRLTEEYITVINTCPTGLDSDGWTLKDAGTNTYRFDEPIPADTAVTIRTGAGQSTRSDRYWGRRQAVWNNAGDAAYLRDNDGFLIAYKAYGSAAY